MKKISSWQNFGGELSVYEHSSVVNQCDMQFAVYTPPQLSDEKPMPVLWYLSGLTCTWANVMEKSAIQSYAAKHGVMIVAPDTSPRGDKVADNESYDLGKGASFYLSAQIPPWNSHYKMDEYIIKELQQLILENFNVDESRQGVLGHSMGGHGAITLHLKNPDLFKTCSAFAPILSPSKVPWGQKAFTHYLGDDKERWAEFDSTELVRKRPSSATILIDQGDADSFLEEQLVAQPFLAAAKESGQQVEMRIQPKYDHSYYFIASFIEEHVIWHVTALNKI